MSDAFADLADRQPGWLDEAGPASDIVLATRARLARNLPDFPFPHHASEVELATILADLRRRLLRLPGLAGGWDLPLAECTATERRALAEKFLVSPREVEQPQHRGLVMARDLGRSVVINQEDHLRLQAFRAGLAPQPALQDVMALDAELEREVAAAFSPEWGYLTASPTNLGTGLRLSALLHLPGLVLVGEIDKVLNALRQLQFSVQGLYGDGGAVRGALFRISNLVTLGRDEEEIAQDFAAHVGKIATYERSARDQLHTRDPLGVEDVVHRSRAVLAAARIITGQEAADHLSNVRLGLGLGLLPAPVPGTLNRLTVAQQTAHLELAAGRHLSGRDKGAARAALLREVFAAEGGIAG